MEKGAVAVQTEPSRLLVIVVPGLLRRFKYWRVLGDALLDRSVFSGYSGVDWKIFDHQLGIFAVRHMRSKACELEAWISAHWDETVHREVMLVGHSAGGALVRQAWLNAVDRTQGAYWMNSAWGRHTCRIVLFAGVSRGVDMQKGFWRLIGGRLLQLLPFHLTTKDCLRGSAFLTNLRISWIRWMAHLPPGERPVIAQILGTTDAIVADGDSLDVDAFPNAIRRRIPDAGHADLHHLNRDRDMRLRLIEDAFTDTPPPAPDPVQSPQTEILMIVHGIRDSSSAGWVQRAEARVRERWPNVHPAAPSYGYLSAWRFAMPNVRKRYSRYFRDFYTELLAERPLARFNVLCHSNGTYLLGQSLKDFDSIRVGRVALAGSVLPREYPWRAMIRDHRVEAIRSDGGKLDWPVGLLCSGLRGVGMRDVGTGGFAGFLDDDLVSDVRYHSGGHGGMLTTSNVDSMLDFIFLQSPAPELRADPSPLGFISRLIAFSAPILLVALAFTFAFCGYQAISTENWTMLIIIILVPFLIYALLETL